MKLKCAIVLAFSLASIDASQHDCACDAAGKEATVNLVQDKLTLSNHLKTVEEEMASFRTEVLSCDTKLTEAKARLKKVQSDLASKIEKLTIKKSELEVKAKTVAKIKLELDEARVVMNDAASKVKEIEGEYKEKINEERDLLRQSEKAIIESYNMRDETKKGLEKIKALKGKKYFNFDGIWEEVVASITGKKVKAKNPQHIYEELTRGQEL
jgi:chromosome segregation ATPase